MASVSLAFEILARDKASKTLKHVGDTADKSGQQVNDFGDKVGRAGGRIGGFAKAAGLAAVGIGGLAVVVGKQLIDAATESQKVTKQTEAVLKSMGPVAGVTAKHVEGLSKRLSEQSGIDDELIQSGQNVLLTFGKVQNKVGKGNKIFDRATEAALNMSVALGTDMQGATIQVGKALNDPVKGITALSRAGVSFTKKQKETIKSLVEQGDTLGAQKIILKELEKQFGGSAAAQATAGERLKVVWGNLQEDLGARLLPAFEAFADFLSRNLPGALDAVGRFLSPVTEQLGMFWDALTTGMTEDEGTPIENVAIGIRDAFMTVRDFLSDELIPTIGDFVTGALASIKAWWDDNGETVKQVASDVFGSIKGVFDDVKGAAEDALPKIAEFGQWFFDNGPGLEVIIAGLTTALAAYAASAVAAAFASLAPIAPFVALAAVVGVLAWVTGNLVNHFKGDLSNAFQWVIDHAISPFADAVRIANDLIRTMLDLIDQFEDKLPDLPGGFNPLGLLPGPLGVLGSGLRFDDGGVMPGPKGVHSLAWVAGGETVVPTHKPGVAVGEEVHLHVTQLPGEDQVGAGMRALRHHKRTRAVLAG